MASDKAFEAIRRHIRDGKLELCAEHTGGRFLRESEAGIDPASLALPMPSDADIQAVWDCCCNPVQIFCLAAERALGRAWSELPESEETRNSVWDDLTVTLSKVS